MTRRSFSHPMPMPPQPIARKMYSAPPNEPKNKGPDARHSCVRRTKSPPRFKRTHHGETRPNAREEGKQLPPVPSTARRYGHQGAEQG
ncbi:hypothetical protein BS50DRAFT_108371 [Corynespora cassiicola Philippines]|uniref:Uncharacterized protein n=1 Tax=Corynespora cassiicola Philippines TaxID=1448308 RepID=A0A2T2NCT9_CORCC|nr:hypothetical protein BS50DRAFT_108371 [Corynespora cassiicola Philippines]